MKTDKNAYPKFFGNQLQMTKGELLQGLTICMLGLVFIFFPGLASDTVFTLIGSAFILIGLINVMIYIMMIPADALESMGLANGLLKIIAGIIIIVFKKLLATILPLLFGLLILAGGVYKLQRAFGFRALGVKAWFAELIISMACIALGIIIMMDLFGTAMMLIRIVGIGLLIVSIEGMVSCSIFRKKCRKGPVSSEV